MIEPALRLDGFGRRYSRRRPWAVRDVSLVVPDGSITALVGPNGAGKSTLIRTFVGFESPTAGRVFVRGVEPRRQRREAVEAIGYVAQGAPLYGNLTIADHLVVARGARKAFDGEYAVRRIRDAGLSTDRKVGELSGGERAQVALALAMGTRAPVLLLDEPLSSLDPLARRDFLTALVDDVHGRGATAVLSSHIVTDVEHACDRLILLGEGRVVFDRSIAEARRAYATIPASELGGRAAIGRFSDTDGRQVALVDGTDSGRDASLEEVVLGHLAAGRTNRRQDAA